MHTLFLVCHYPLVSKIVFHETSLCCNGDSCFTCFQLKTKIKNKYCSRFLENTYFNLCLSSCISKLHWLAKGLISKKKITLGWKRPYLKGHCFSVCRPFLKSAAANIFHFISSLRAEHFITYLGCIWFSICPSPPVSYLSPWVCLQVGVCALERLLFTKVVFHLVFFLFISWLSCSGNSLLPGLVSPWWNVSFLDSKVKKRLQILTYKEDWTCVEISPQIFYPEIWLSKNKNWYLIQQWLN